MLKCTVAAITLAGAALAPPALAMSCGERDTVVAQLGTRHQEELVAAGLHDPQHLIELWTTRDGATWTLLLTRADGVTCVLSSGSAWYAYPEKRAVGVEG
jgi:hypothetical protein